MEKEFQQQTLYEIILEKSVLAENQKFSQFVCYNVRYLNSVMGTLEFQDSSYVCSRERWSCLSWEDLTVSEAVGEKRKCVAV